MADEQGVTGREAWTIAVLLWLATIGITTVEIAPASVLQLVAADLDVSPTGVSWLVSVFLLGMVVFSLPAGLVLDRGDDRRVILVMGVGYLLSTGWAAWAGAVGDYWSLVAARFVGGAVNIVLWTAAINVVGAVFVRTRQGTGLGFLLTAIPLGFATSHVLTPVLATAVGWPSSFVLYGLVTAAAVGAFWRYTAVLDLEVQTATPDREAFVRVLSNPWVWAVGGLAFAAFSLNLFFNNWLPTYLIDTFGFSIAQGGAFAAVFPAIGAVARMTSGSLSDRLMGGRRNPIVLGSFVVITPLIVLIAVVQTVVLLLTALVVAGFVTQMGLALLLPYARELVDENVTATAIAVLNLVGFVGAFLTPVLTGWLIERSGGYALAFGYAFGLAVLGVALAWLVPEAGGRQARG